MSKISDFVTPSRTVSDAYLRKRGQEIYDDAFKIAATGVSYKQLCKQLHIDPALMRLIRAEDTDFDNKLSAAMESASILAVDEIRDIPYSEDNPHRARVKIDALRTYLELRWPRLYGKKLDITIQTLDMRQALDLARERAANRALTEQRTIDITPQKDDAHQDSDVLLAALLE